MFQNLFTNNLVNSFLNHFGFYSTSLLFQTWWTKPTPWPKTSPWAKDFINSNDFNIFKWFQPYSQQGLQPWISLRTTSETRNVTQDLRTKETQLGNHHHLWSFCDQEFSQGNHDLIQEESTKKDGKISSEPYRWTTILGIDQTYQLMWCNKNIFGCLKIMLETCWLSGMFVCNCLHIACVNCDVSD